MRFFLVSLIALGATSCTTLPDVVKEEQAMCPVIESKNWHAWIDPKPSGQDSFVLNISGDIDLPTPAYQVTLTAGPMNRKMPPDQRFDLQAKPTGGMAAQVITLVPVRYREATPYSHYGSIMIFCDEQELATIRDVTIME